MGKHQVKAKGWLAKWLTQGTVNNNYLPVTYPNDYL
ncbi:hypothetical protein H744_1c1727 [Photobacterium gaetbulicola Gung47]|uniref:Uncharacterized protein n=1 Tax=Photobacterium gaetbulicola Gung47 TaxID=658445 RepID=A0A0C5WUQ1_9GAMM|nr:hypothetical protein H744_1c1727 [Photobacterium gaetbulicola Gung47]